MRRLSGAMDKLRDEMAARHEDSMLCQVGELLCAYLQDKPEAAEAIAAEGKTIAGAVEAMEKRARKKARNSRAGFTLLEGMEIVLDYFGLEMDRGAMLRAALGEMTGADQTPASREGDELDLDSLLGGVPG